MGKLFKQLARCATLDPPHDFARGHSRWATHQYVYMVFAYHSTNDPYLESLTSLPDKFSDPLRQFPCQHFVSILCNPYKMVLYLVYRMQTFRYSIAAKADRLKPVV
jgi:hypothetical protein